MRKLHCQPFLSHQDEKYFNHNLKTFVCILESGIYFAPYYDKGWARGRLCPHGGIIQHYSINTRRRHDKWIATVPQWDEVHHQVKVKL